MGEKARGTVGRSTEAIKASEEIESSDAIYERGCSEEYMVTSQRPTKII